jgi:xanthine phosphoribosyltransferase
MDRLKQKIIDEAVVIDNRIVKVDHFINHMLDTELLFQIGLEFKNKFQRATKILTIETSGIAYAVSTAFHLNQIPVVFAKKTTSLITGNNVYQSEVWSFTKEMMSKITVDRSFINENDQVLIVDDFLAKGNALKGLVDIVKQANATVVGVGIVIEKGFEGARLRFKDEPFEIYSLANIKELKENRVFF